MSRKRKCCCGSPCGSCGGTQPSATASASGGPCNGYPDGTYTFGEFVSTDTDCQWRWDYYSEFGHFLIRVYYNKTTGLWKVSVRLGGGAEIVWFTTDWFDGAGIIGCSGGVLTGTIRDIPNDPVWNQCPGGTATVVLG